MHAYESWQLQMKMTKTMTTVANQNSMPQMNDKKEKKEEENEENQNNVPAKNKDKQNRKSITCKSNEVCPVNARSPGRIPRPPATHQHCPSEVHLTNVRMLDSRNLDVDLFPIVEQCG